MALLEAPILGELEVKVEMGVRVLVYHLSKMEVREPYPPLVVKEEGEAGDVLTYRFSDLHLEVEVPAELLILALDNQLHDLEREEEV